MTDCLSELVSIGQGATVADPSAELPTSSSRPSLHPQPLSPTYRTCSLVCLLSFFLLSENGLMVALTNVAGRWVGQSASTKEAR